MASGLISGLLSTAASFLPGGGIISKLIPGAVDIIGNIANKVINRPEGQSIGKALLEAAPEALTGASGLASEAVKHTKNTDDPRTWTKLYTTGYYDGKSREPYKQGAGTDYHDGYLRGYNEVEAYKYSPSEDRDVTELPPEILNPTAPASISATDHLPVVHGPPTQPPTVPVTSAAATQPIVLPDSSGPFTAHGMPPAAAYNVDRTQQQSFGAAPSFNVFDKLASRPQREEVIVEDEDEDESPPPKIVYRYIKRKKDKKYKKRGR